MWGASTGGEASATAAARLEQRVEEALERTLPAGGHGGRAAVRHADCGLARGTTVARCCGVADPARSGEHGAGANAPVPRRVQRRRGRSPSHLIGKVLMG